MGTSIFGIGISGMNAAHAGLITTGHNISNATTPGYNRQQVVESSSNPQFTGAGFLGQGVTVSTIKRIYNDTLAGQLTQAQAHGSQLDAFDVRIKQLSNLLGSDSAGLAPAMQEFFGSVADLAAHVESSSSRFAMLSAADTVSARFASMDQQLAQMRTTINADITATIETINGFARQIAELNRSIVVSESAGALQPANDLLDQRDALVADLNREVRATVVRESNGSYDVFVGNGQPVVVGGNHVALAAVPSLEDPQHTDVGYQSGGSVVRLAAASIQGGMLGGLLAFRDSTLDTAQNSLGRVAMGFAQSFNRQHALGQDLNGALGTPFFSIAEPSVLPSSGNGGGGGVVAVLEDSDALTTSDYHLQYYGATAGVENYLLVRDSDGATQTISFPSAGGYPHSLSIDGIGLTLQAGAATNDSWVVQPCRGGASGISVLIRDPAAIAAAGPVRTAAALANTGSGVISSASVSSVTGLPLAAPVTLTFDAAAGQFQVGGAVPAVGPVAYTAGNTMVINGFEFTISGNPRNGDVFTIDRNVNGISDNRNALALGDLQLASTLGRNASVPGSKAALSFQGAYSELVSHMGNAARQSAVMVSAQQNLIAQTQQAQQSVSGVNLDEEAANLLRYQQAYQASGKMMQIASTLFQSVLELGR